MGKKTITNFIKNYPYISGWLLYSFWTAIGIRWFWGMYPMEFMGLEKPHIAIVLIGFAWISVSVAIGLAGSVMVYAWRLTGWNQSPWVVASIWTLGEVLGSLNFSILTYAEQSMFGPHFSFNYLGYQLGGTYIAKIIAPWGGVFLLSWILVFAAVCTWQVLSTRKANLLNMFFLFGITMTMFFASQTQESKTQLNTSSKKEVIAVRLDQEVRFNFDKERQSEVVEKIDSIIKDAHELYPGAELVVLPEDSRYLQWYRENGLHPPHPNLLIVDSAREESAQALSVITTYHHLDGFKQGYVKNLLVSEGEYISWYYKLFAVLVGQFRLVREFEDTREYQRGNHVFATMTLMGPIGASLCSELLSPWIQVKMASQSPLLVNLASHAILHGHPLLERQSKRLTQTTAASLGKPVVRSGNHNRAIIVDRFGFMVSDTQTENALAYGTVLFDNRKTFFGMYPAFILWIAFFIVSAATMTNRKPSRV